MRVEGETKRLATIGEVIYQAKRGLNGAAVEEFDFSPFATSTGIDVEELAKMAAEAETRAQRRW